MKFTESPCRFFLFMAGDRRTSRKSERVPVRNSGLSQRFSYNITATRRKGQRSVSCCSERRYNIRTRIDSKAIVNFALRNFPSKHDRLTPLFRFGLRPVNLSENEAAYACLTTLFTNDRFYPSTKNYLEQGYYKKKREPEGSLF
jgi:hypothetical protein